MNYLYAVVLCGLVSSVCAQQVDSTNNPSSGPSKDAVRFNEPYIDPNTGNPWGHTNSGGAYTPSLIRYCDACGTAHDTNNNSNNNNNSGNAA